MDAPSLALCLVSPKRDVGQSLIDLRKNNLVVLDLAITPTSVHAIKIPFTSSVQSHVQLPPSVLTLNALWRSDAPTEGICKDCEGMAERLGREPSALDFHSDSDIIPVSQGFTRIAFTITCPWFHLSPYINEEPMLEIVLSHNSSSQVLKVTSTLPYRFLISTEPEEKELPVLEMATPLSFSDTSENESLPQEYTPPALEIFPNTLKLLNQFGEDCYSLDEWSKHAVELMASAQNYRQVISTKTDRDGRTLAHLAALYKCDSLWEELKRSDIGLTVQASDGHDALHFRLSSQVTRARSFRPPRRNAVATYEPDPIKLQASCRQRGGTKFACQWIQSVFKDGVTLEALVRRLKRAEIESMNFPGGFEPLQAYDGFLQKANYGFECCLCPVDSRVKFRNKKDMPRHLRKYHFGLADQCRTCNRSYYSVGELTRHRCIPPRNLATPATVMGPNTNADTPQAILYTGW